jgi:hypothetical protein
VAWVFAVTMMVCWLVILFRRRTVRALAVMVAMVFLAVFLVRLSVLLA